MAGLFLKRIPQNPGAPDLEARAPDAHEGQLFAAAKAQFARLGFTRFTELAIPGWRLMHACPIQGGSIQSTQVSGRPSGLYRDGADFVAIAGTLTYGPHVGDEALKAFLQQTQIDTASGRAFSPDWSLLGGQFIALIFCSCRAFLFTDFFGAFQLFHTDGQDLFSTSLLAAAGALPRVRWHRQALYEYAFHISPLGNDSIFAELKRLGPERMLELTPSGAVAHALVKPLPTGIDDSPPADRLKRLTDRLMAQITPYAQAYGNAIHCPLSGGLDSRLVLAGLRCAGVQPQIYVYGQPESSDVTVAQAIGKALGFPVEWICKDAYRAITPDEFPDQVAQNFHHYDGLPNYGGLFDNGGNWAALRRRHADGDLAVSGGCGEVYRNFFYLPDRPLSARAIVRAFFSQFDARDTTARFDEARFLRVTEDKILDALGHTGNRGRLPRTVVEQAYPRVRCRSLFGWEVSLEGRHSAYLMPFWDHRLVAEALTLPMPLKNAGRFEAELITALDPVLASQPSAYGHDFTTPPGWRHRFSEASTRVRPLGLRARSYALRRRLGRFADPQAGLLADDYMGRVIDPTCPHMRRYFNVDAIADGELWRRIAGLEYLAMALGSKLAEEDDGD